MSITTIEEIKENLVNYLFKWRKQIAIGGVVVAILVLFTIINKVTPNNSAWLQGNWTNQSVNYSFKAQNKNFTDWTIKRKGALALKKARVAVNSTKKEVVMTDDGNTIEYHVIRTGRKQLRLEIVRDGKKKSLVELNKE
ncbi:hypothetical protein P7D97_02480 [Enterococcus raffinosus]|uniref:hypothetical protein n=1 Tax=Enterococcus raffinosus TaxID=71452 RepID=UPI001C44D725|nr:hypothetical protein [Enterococcus raffinosus]MDT2570467.1 hypothetical protein [Enterococcus raffinosus]QXJ59632.1 hypothetical protein J9537_02225 [Enterococcus raffinosus]